jgi:hypothetical protein
VKRTRREHLARLADVREAIAAIRTHVSRGELDDMLVFDAVRMRLVEIGEAVGALPDEVLSAEPAITLFGQLYGPMVRLARAPADDQEPGSHESTVRTGPRKRRNAVSNGMGGSCLDSNLQPADRESTMRPWMTAACVPEGSDLGKIAFRGLTLADRAPPSNTVDWP